MNGFQSLKTCFSSSLTLAIVTEGSKSNIPCCALLARQVRATVPSDSRIWRASGTYVTQMLRAKFTYDVRHVARASCKCCAHLPREERATRDGPLCASLMKGKINCETMIYHSLMVYCLILTKTDFEPNQKCTTYFKFPYSLILLAKSAAATTRYHYFQIFDPFRKFSFRHFLWCCIVSS
jgi:hypothetical protein